MIESVDINVSSGKFSGKGTVTVPFPFHIHMDRGSRYLVRMRVTDYPAYINSSDEHVTEYVDVELEFDIRDLQKAFEAMDQ